MTRSRTFSFLGGVMVSCAVAAGCDGPVKPSTFFISGVSPRAGTMLGGTLVTISGGGFLSGTKVEIGGIAVEANVESDKKITANAPAHAAGTVDVVVTNIGWQRYTRFQGYTFELDPAFTISGTVTEMTDEGEIPVEGVEITETGTRTFTTTDARGAYRFGDLRRLVKELWISKPGYVDDVKSVAASSDMQLDLRVERIPSFVLSGMVYEATQNGRVPLDGVVLYCDGCGSPVGHTFVTTDGNGLYRFAWTQSGKNWIQFISKDGYGYAGPIESLGIPVNVNGNTRFDIELVKR